MTGNADRLPRLVVADRRFSGPDITALRQQEKSHDLFLIDLSPDGCVETAGLVMRQLRIDELLDLDAFHRDLREFLDRWPQSTQVDGRPFADVFRQTTGDSLWWTGPGSLRHPFSGPLVPPLKAAWIVKAACDRHQIQHVLLQMAQPSVVSLLLSTSNASFTCERLPGCAKPAASCGTRWNRVYWWIFTLLSVALLGVWVVVRAAYARLATRPQPPDPDDVPSVVMSGWFPNHVRRDQTGRPQIDYWARLAECLSRRAPQTRIRYLLHTTTHRFHGWKRILRPIYAGWRQLSDVEGLLPLSHGHPMLRSFLHEARHQLHMMNEYLTLESSGELARTSRFAGADASELLIPHLRVAVATMAKWTRNVAAIAASLRAAGQIGVVLVHEEFYPKGMLTIAASRQLGLPTLGVQHGLISPQHTMYMPPPGHIADAPCPDRFAAFGEFAANVLSRSGAYPRDCIDVVGAPRLDGLCHTQLNRQQAREVLGWSPDQAIILVTAETYRLSASCLEALFPLAVAHPQWRIVVKLHPHDRDPSTWDALVASSPAENVELHRDRLPELMAACDMLITGFSTTAIEALLLNKPVVCADFTSWPDRYPFATSEAARGAATPDKLGDAVVQALQHPVDEACRQAFLHEHLGPTASGNAGDVFSQLIVERYLCDDMTG